MDEKVVRVDVGVVVDQVVDGGEHEAHLVDELRQGNDLESCCSAWSSV
jgi:hypothetical protein